MVKDKMELMIHKKSMIDEIKSLDKSKMFEIKPKKKKTILSKLLIILGYGKKG
jgi:hypothetical protein